jgi:hypothetical protein
MPGGGARAGSSGREWRTTRRRHDVGWVSSSREQQQGMEDLLSSFGGKGATAGARARAVEQKSQTLGAMRALRSFILPWPKQRSRAHQIARSAPPAKSPGLRTCALRPPPPPKHAFVPLPSHLGARARFRTAYGREQGASPPLRAYLR